MTLFLEELRGLIDRFQRNGSATPLPVATRTDLLTGCQKVDTADTACSAALKALIAAKTASNRRPRYVYGLEKYIGMFIAGREFEPVASITTADVERWFRVRAELPGTMSANMGRLNSLFEFCRRRGWIESNPVKRIERPRVEVPEPFILTVDQCRTLIESCAAYRPTLIAPLTLAMFCGLRPVEIQRLQPANIDLTNAVVVLSAAQSKTRRRRSVPIPPNALATLRSHPLVPGGRNGWCRLVLFMTRTLGFETWPQDALRHTAASMMLARDKDAGKVSLWLGNSPAILMRHYVSLVGVEDCRKFWTIEP